MIRLTRFLTPALAVIALSGCAMIQDRFAKPPFEDTESAPVEVTEAVSEPESEVSEGVKEASTAPAGAGALGQTVASLGDPTRPGFWLKTPLVEAERPGRIAGADGTSVQVTLIPLEASSGAGSEISLSAMRALGLSLTDLAPIEVFAL
ncbi:MAG: hypothetical protein AAF700_05640 [Pseudomonadota bacterium]